MEIFGIFLSAYTCATVVVYGFVVAALLLERQASTVNAFYTIYMTGCFADTLSIINAFFTYCALTGFLHADWLNAPISIRVMQTIVWGSRLSQNLTVWMIAFNRLTAITLPLLHATIWSSHTIRICTVIQLVSLLLFGGTMAFSLNPIRVPSALGGTQTALNISISAQQQLYLSTTIFTSVNGLIVIVCYAMMLLIVAWRKINNQSNYGNERNLYVIALVVCTVEILSMIQQFASTQCKLTREIMNCIYIAGIFIYDSIPPYLLIIFSRAIRTRLILMLNVRCLTTLPMNAGRRSTLVGPMINIPPK